MVYGPTDGRSSTFVLVTVDVRLASLGFVRCQLRRTFGFLRSSELRLACRQRAIIEAGDVDGMEDEICLEKTGRPFDFPSRPAWFTSGWTKPALSTSGKGAR